jgi:subtilase family serine protease
MRSSMTMKSFGLNCLVVFSVCLLITQPILAERPPDGDARPPIHVKGNSTKAPTGLSPAQVRTAYGFDQLPNQGEGQTIAIVDAYDDPNIVSDLNTFKNQFGIDSQNCSFKKAYAQGFRPRTDPGWSLEISLDVEWACAIAPKANILLVEAYTNSFANLFGAVDYAATKANVVSMSWGGGEFSTESSNDGHFITTKNNVVFTASSGDSGNGVEYPAASPYVLAVGGTTLHLNADGTYSETAWSGSGGGISSYEGTPAWQLGVKPNNGRGVPDVAYDADPATGFSVYDSVRYQGQSGWFQVGGTSAGAPQWAAFIAIVNSGRVTAPAPKPVLGGTSWIYSKLAASGFNDITSGSNGTCGSVCSAASGYDYVTGLGSPIAVALYHDLVVDLP